MTEFAQRDENIRKEANAPPMCDFILATPSVLEPILLFCTSTIRVRDTRSVVTIVRVLRSLLPRFKEKSPIRDYFCNDILKNAITSLHEPYFVDCQKELASLIGGINDTYRVDRKMAKLRGANRQDERMQRSIVLDLMSSIKGVSIHEQGKIQRPKGKGRSQMMEQYMTVDQPTTIVRGTSPGLAGVADMFGES
jgi:exportin-5